MTERDDFDKIVEGLDLHLVFPDEAPDPEPQPAARAPEEDSTEKDAEDAEDAEDEPFYRRVSPTPLIPRHRGTLLAWLGVLGAPTALAVAMLLGEFLGRPIIAGVALIFVAGAIYLILQLPEHGPSRRDWPDDGAVL